MTAPAPSPYAGTSAVAALDPLGTVTLVEGQTFCLSDRAGDLAQHLPHGLFILDTRVLSRWELDVNGHRLEPLAVQVDDPYAATFVTRSHAAVGQADADLVVVRHRHIGWGMRERIVVTNHGLEPVPLTVELFADGDFADLFAVKELRVDHGRARRSEVTAGGLLLVDAAGPHPRHTAIEVADPATIEPGMVAWRRVLEPGEVWETCIEVLVSVDGDEIEPRFRCGDDAAAAVPAERLRVWRATVPETDTDDPRFVRALHQAADDLGALRIFDPEHPELPVIAAGAPWFMTVFGRDSLLTGWMSLIADPSLAHGVLRTLARFQGTEVDDATEEEPGKILHEMRFTTATGLALQRGEVYYGSIDATPLFVMLLGELRRWDPRDELVEELLPHADRALAWIERYGDRDGDGYVEYQRRSEDGLANQGWKDSWDAVRHADGVLAPTPIALCEVQGYVYAAYVARAHFAREAGDTATHDHYVAKAAELRRRFNEDFWIPELGTYAMALDADKRPVAVAASNVGHCLWTGIVDPDRAPLVADRLLDRTMFSGWGVRTLGTHARAYNPVSYHNGSVWPHDNALCAAGLARYGLDDHALRIIEAQLDVAAANQGRLPELFAGFDRSEIGVAAAYPTSCSPQAWAAASPLLWLRTLLHLDPWAPRGRLWVAPRLPASMRRLRVSGIRVGDLRIDIEVDGDDVRIDGTGDLEVIRSPRPALSSLLIEAEQGRR